MYTISNIKQENHNIATLTLSSENRAETLIWVPGQFVKMSIRHSGAWSKEHFFTIASCPQDSRVQITFKVNGDFTRTLYTAKKETPVSLKGPYGTFCTDIEKKQNIVLIAGGTGITPFLSVLRNFNFKQLQNNILLFWANTEIADIFRNDELFNLTKTLNLKIIHLIWEGNYLRTDLIKGPNITYHNGLLSAEIISSYLTIETPEFYMCGPPKMTEYIKMVIDQMGVKNVHSESM